MNNSTQETLAAATAFAVSIALGASLWLTIVNGMAQPLV
jgi:hypothetical protein